MVGGYHVYRAVQQSLYQRGAVGLAAQRRVHLEAAVLLQVRVRQQQVVGGGLAGDIHAPGLGVTYYVN